MGKERSVLKRLMEDSPLSELELTNQPLVEICGRHRVLMEGHCGVKEYGHERICVAVPGGQVVVCGCRLELRCMSRHQLIITGSIHGVSLQGRDGR